MIAAEMMQLLETYDPTAGVVVVWRQADGKAKLLFIDEMVQYRDCVGLTLVQTSDEDEEDDEDAARETTAAG